MPKVEVLRSDRVLPTDYFTIDLLDPEPFNQSLFDESALKLGGEKTQAFLRYIVGGNRMFVFPDAPHFNHAAFFEFVMKGEGELQSAGRISLIIEGDGAVSRRIGGDAMTLMRLLSSTQSINYRRTLIVEKLGDSFVITE